MITLHHLNFSRSTRALWLLEELGIEYELVEHKRDQNFRAPPSLSAVHPLGKAPVIVDDGLILAESGTILRYLEQKYGDGRLVPAPGTPDRAVHDEWLDFVESSAALPVMLTLLGGMTGGLPEGLKAFTSPELSKTLGYISDRVTDRTYLMGDRLTLADIQMSYLLAALGRTGQLDAYPAVAEYLDRLEETPGLRKAIEKGGPMAPPDRA
ncbi:glutathione S-transferase family protein [Sphingomonas sp. CGMCC 1.13654]|uniref:glutathione transferase n=1 Tax=Sphingomonas chungangi TaxID=2683589 RepID=A0A838LDG2_9SPHN|nr:glutathione S-transferase family protein [Sphingomonas chungangi]MBA2935538.1 glutathione S-transferase family protein [Sphingomonas chungangi]MVW54231.1 glutathione S-transferase family protein [Sphingomonas chungangi]